MTGAGTELDDDVVVAVVCFVVVTTATPLRAENAVSTGSFPLAIWT